MSSFRLPLLLLLSATLARSLPSPEEQAGAREAAGPDFCSGQAHISVQSELDKEGLLPYMGHYAATLEAVCADATLRQKMTLINGGQRTLQFHFVQARAKPARTVQLLARAH